jgi:uncharacterized alkaline shock family protein YloU
MNAFNGLLVVVGSLVGIAVGVLILLIVTETVSPQDFPGEAFRQELASMAAHTGGALWRDVGIAIGLIAAGLLVLVLEARQLTRGVISGMLLLSSEADGVVRLSLDSITELAKRSGAGNRDVRNIRCHVQTTSGGLSIHCEVGLRMGADVPAASSDVQKNIREIVERLTSLPVRDVPVRARYLGDRDQPVLVR